MQVDEHVFDVMCFSHMCDPCKYPCVMCIMSVPFSARFYQIILQKKNKNKQKFSKQLSCVYLKVAINQNIDIHNCSEVAFRSACVQDSVIGSSVPVGPPVGPSVGPPVGHGRHWIHGSQTGHQHGVGELHGVEVGEFSTHT